MINPYQAYRVKTQNQLGPSQLQVLTQLYQPFMGGLALSLYLTLANQPLEALNWSTRQLHAVLISQMNVGIKDFNQARVNLEGAGLLETYRDQSSHSNHDRQTIIYELKWPLSSERFFKDPQLSLALFNQIGDQAYFNLIKQWINQSDLEDSWRPMTLDFSSVYHVGNQSNRLGEIQEAVQGLDFKDRSGLQIDPLSLQDLSFNFDLYLQILSTKSVNMDHLTQAVLLQIASLSQFYQLDEAAMAQVTYLAQNPISGHINLVDLKTYAQKQVFFKQERKKPEMTAQDQPLDIDPQLKTNYPHFSDKELEIVTLCQSLSPKEFLQRVKVAAGGFATSSEYHFVKELQKNSSLSNGVINMLIYYLIALEKKATFEKGWSDRIANEWQQAGLKDPAQTLDYLHKAQEKKKDQAKNDFRTAKFNKYAKRSKRQEKLPSWLATSDRDKHGSEESLSTDNQTNSGVELSEDEIRQRLQVILKKEGR